MVILVWFVKMFAAPRHRANRWRLGRMCVCVCAMRRRRRRRDKLYVHKFMSSALHRARIIFRTSCPIIMTVCLICQMSLGHSGTHGRRVCTIIWLILIALIDAAATVCFSFWLWIALFTQTHNNLLHLTWPLCDRIERVRSRSRRHCLGSEHCSRPWLIWYLYAFMQHVIHVSRGKRG